MNLPRSLRCRKKYVLSASEIFICPTGHPRPGARARNFFSALVPGSGNFQLSRLAGFGYGLRFWVVFTIIVSLTLSLTLITTLTVILP